MQVAELPSIEAGKFRSAMGAFATGVAVVTTCTEAGLHGMAVNSLTSVSLDPCQLLFCVKKESATGAAIKARGAFAINLLSGGQQHLVKQFCANPEDRFAGVPMLMSPCGMPVLRGALASMCCTIVSIHESGDHEIVVGHVHAIEEVAGDPLVFFRGGYGGYQGTAARESTVRQVAV